METKTILVFILWMVIQDAKCAYPGTFYWKPRLALDFTGTRTTTYAGQTFTKVKYKPTVNEIVYGVVVLINGYELGTTVLGLAVGHAAWEKYPHLNPFKAWFYTTAYRWLLRHLSLYPEWLKGGGRTYIDTHRVWRKRFTQLETFVPTWLQYFFPHVWEWDRERKQFRRYLRYVEPAFGKHYHYPGPIFDGFKSEETTETIENFDIENRSIDNFNNADY